MLQQQGQDLAGAKLLLPLLLLAFGLPAIVLYLLAKPLMTLASQPSASDCCQICRRTCRNQKLAFGSTQLQMALPSRPDAAKACTSRQRPQRGQ